MPHLFVVTDQKDLEALAPQLLRGRVSAANRAAALDGIRQANPTLDLDQLAPGAVVVVPAELPGLRDSLADDSLGGAVSELIDQVMEGLDGLVTAADEAEGRRRSEQQEAAALFDSDIVRRLATVDRVLAANLEEAARTFRDDDVEAKQQRAALKRASGQWAEELKVLRGLLP